MELDRKSSENVKYLSKIFSASIIKSSIKNDNYNRLKSIITESGFGSLLDKKKIIDIYSDAFNLLSKYHRNEYIYKTAIIEQILFGKHNLQSSLYSEFQVENCKADIAIFNGTSTVYEIKTELDTFDRLERQLIAYRKAFDKIYVITPISHLDKILNYVDQEIGILLLERDNKIITYRDPISNLNNIKNSVLFDLLKREESLKVIQKELGLIVDVPNTQTYSVSKELFSNIPNETAHRYVVEILKKRGLKTKEFLLKTPIPFHTFIANSYLTKNEQASFLNFIDSAIIN